MTDGPPKGRRRTGPSLQVLSPLAGAAIFAGATIGLVIVLLVVGLWKDRSDRLAQVRSDAETRAILLAQHADGVLRQVDIALAAAAFNLEERDPEGTRPEPRDPLQRFMARHLPTGGCLVIFGPDGGIRSSACPRSADLALDDATLRDHAGGRITGSMGHDHVLGLIALRRSILDRRGRFLGIAQASFQAVALLGYGHTAGVEQVEILALPDGDIVVGPSDMFAGQRQDVAVDAVALIGSGRRDAGAIQVAERDGLIAAAVQARVLPLLAVAATRTGEMMAAWWRTVTIAALIVGILAAGALLLLARLFHIERSRSDAFSELRLKDHALAQSSNGILICRAVTDTPIAWVNHAFERNTGYASAEVVGRNPRFMHGAEIAQPALEEIRRALRDSSPVVATVRNFRKDGSLFYNQVSIAPVCDDDGRLTHFIGIQHDVTDRILAERALEDRARFEHTLLDTIPLPVFFKDMDGVYLGANRAFEQALGLERGGIRGLRVTDLADPETAEVYAEVDRDLRLHGGSRTFETKVRHADGSLRAAVISKAVFLNAASQRAGIVGVFSDIDEIRRREAELANLVDQRDRERARAEEANRAKSNFLACMSHELRTPLNAILGFSEIIRERSFGDDLDRYAEYAGDIHASGEHLLSLINDILDLSKIEAGKLDLAPHPLAIGPVVNSVIKLVRQRAEDHGHSLHVDLGDAEDEPLYADERAVKQILFNLLSNAIKFTPDRGRIDLACRLEAGSRVELSVSDTGIGIPADRLLTVLQPFERIDSAYTRGQEGTGLGLSLVDALVKGHGGTLAIDSTVDVGTRVRITLPTVKQTSGMAA
ncbi:PAS domain S-box protein [Skermanella rosea]|uniref:sensor histidine kinase n=1 Tax=Skermanella rosea TaxID=1817965 RepID=UPI001931E3F7|nr:PAS domain S-box protein [Skermanella rosea]UEM03026.1 PAS domain S-box protein [Skermanella rosea]